jgi:D-amino-acid dehydrogenase
MNVLQLATSRHTGTIAERFDVAVLGAGVVGVATAYALARRGHSVALIDRRDQPGGGASYANGAQLSYAYADALGGPTFLSKLPSLLLGSDPLFRINAAFDIEMVTWGVRFLAACSRSANQRATIETLKLALESQAAMHALLQRHPLEFGHAAAGKMHLYFDISSFAEARKCAELKRTYGAAQHLLSPSEATSIEPALSGAAGLHGVIHSPGDEVGDARQFCVALTGVLQENYRVSPMFGFGVTDIETHADHAVVAGNDGRAIEVGQVIVAAGIEGRALLRRLGVHAPLLAMRGYSFNAPAGLSAPRVSLTDTARKIVFCQLNGQIRIAGGAELGVADDAVDPARIATLVDAAKASLPAAADYSRMCDPWAGLRPMTPTSTPTIRRVSERVVLNIGHGMLGWTLALGAGERAATLVSEQRS